MWVHPTSFWRDDVDRAVKSDIVRRLCREHGVRFHTDAVQAVGRMPVDVAALEAQALEKARAEAKQKAAKRVMF